jgi:hypothetical protein
MVLSETMHDPNDPKGTMLGSMLIPIPELTFSSEMHQTGDLKIADGRYTERPENSFDKLNGDLVVNEVMIESQRTNT